jgi:hypothetical protein
MCASRRTTACWQPIWETRWSATIRSAFSATRANSATPADRQAFFQGLVDTARSQDPFWTCGADLDANVPREQWSDVFVAVAIKRASVYHIKLTVQPPG